MRAENESFRLESHKNADEDEDKQGNDGVKCVHFATSNFCQQISCLLSVEKQKNVFFNPRVEKTRRAQGYAHVQIEKQLI